MKQLHFLGALLLIQGCAGVRGVKTVLSPAFELERYRNTRIFAATASADDKKLAEEFASQLREINIVATIDLAHNVDQKEAQRLGREMGVDALVFISVSYRRGITIVSLRMQDARSDELVMTATVDYDSGLTGGLDHHAVAARIADDLKAKLRSQSH